MEMEREREREGRERERKKERHDGVSFHYTVIANIEAQEQTSCAGYHVSGVRERNISYHHLSSIP